MKVTLINHTQNALELLLYTKNTRLQGAQSLQDIINWPVEKKLEELAYMRDTIQSSWEFTDYVFHIEGVTRAFTHQLVRTRTGSYAQQSQRTVDVREQEIINPTGDVDFELVADYVIDEYANMIDNGMEVQDARGILPTNMTTEIITKFDLRTLHNMGLTRLCTRTQGEYQEVFKAMVEEVVKVHPWAKDFIKVACAWNGVCAFPRYSECPIQGYTMKPYENLLGIIETLWEETDHVANPIAKNGKSM